MNYRGSGLGFAGPWLGNTERVTGRPVPFGPLTGERTIHGPARVGCDMAQYAAADEWSADASKVTCWKCRLFMADAAQREDDHALLSRAIAARGVR